MQNLQVSPAVWDELETGNVPTQNSHVAGVWIDAFTAINAANTIITQIPNVRGLAENDRNEFLGTAHFVRGLMFFDLLRHYGAFEVASSEFGIPLKLTPSTELTSTARSSVIESYTQIENDLKQASSLLGNSSSKYYASKVASQALLARVYLYKKNYAQAFTYADSVIENSSGYLLLPNYNQIYLTENSEEAIFELAFDELDPSVWIDELTGTSKLKFPPVEVFCFSIGQK